MSENRFTPYTIFTYNQKKKIVSALSWIGAILILAAVVIAYFSLFKNTHFFLLDWIGKASNHVMTNMDLPTMHNSTNLGIFYSSLIGGLFFVIMSMEALFINLLRSGHPVQNIIFFYILGIIVSYTINYFIGMKLSNLAKSIVTPRKFYKIKGIINKWGALGIFVFNVTPLPSQPLSAILGAVKYNKTRFYIFFLLGQIIKYSVIMIVVMYFI